MYFFRRHFLQKENIFHVLERTHNKKEFGLNEKELIEICLFKIMLSNDELERYSRQIKEIGEKNQEKLKSKTVMQIGAGGLGGPLALYLTAAGIGHLKIVDYDTVSLSNLNRQILYNSNDLNNQKNIVAKTKLQNLNPDIKITTINRKLNYENYFDIMENIDYLIDASDNLYTKFLINDISLDLDIPCTIAGVQSMEGQIISIEPHESACYRCVFGDIEEKDKDKFQKEIDKQEKEKRQEYLGILGFTCGVLGSIEAAETIKGLLGLGDRLLNSLMMVDLAEMKFAKIKVSKNQNCIC